MRVLGITGGIGMGKSTAGGFLAAFGFPIADTDLIARELVQPGQPQLEEIRQQFGPAVLEKDGSLDRTRLADLVFGQPGARERLEAILHPPIRTEWQRRVKLWRSEGRPLAVVVIPLLFETHAEALMDVVLCVACSSRTQRERLRRRGWAEEHVERRLAAQLSIEEKMRRSTFVVWTEPPPSIHEAQIRHVLEHLGLSDALTPPGDPPTPEGR